MNILHPDTNSEVYRQFIRLVNEKVRQAELWLTEHNINYVWNYWVGDHLYRLYISDKDLILDFEYYPVINYYYSNYIRVNFDTDIVALLENLFIPKVIQTNDLTLFKLNQRAVNRFLREQGESPCYDKNVIRLGYVKDEIIYLCAIVKDNKIISCTARKGWSVSGGAFMILRYLNEQFGFSEILFKEDMGNSAINSCYQMLGLTLVSQSNKKKIWWSPSGTKWHIKREDTDKYIPFYFCEYRIYKYSKITLVC